MAARTETHSSPRPKEFDLSPRSFSQCIVLLGGGPATGKTTLGYRLEEITNISFLDVERPEMAIPLLHARVPVGLAVPSLRPAHVSSVMRLSDWTGAPLVPFALHAPDEIVRKRLRETGRTDDLSISPLDDGPGSFSRPVLVNTNSSVERSLNRILKFLSPFRR